jgi:hypothetical protein
MVQHRAQTIDLARDTGTQKLTKTLMVSRMKTPPIAAANWQAVGWHEFTDILAKCTKSSSQVPLLSAIARHSTPAFNGSPDFCVKLGRDVKQSLAIEDTERVLTWTWFKPTIFMGNAREHDQPEHTSDIATSTYRSRSFDCSKR